MNAVFNDFFFQICHGDDLLFQLILFDNPTERGAMQLVFRTPTRTPTGVVRGCFSLFVIVRKPLKTLRFRGFSFSPETAMFILESRKLTKSITPVTSNVIRFPNDGFLSPARKGVQKGLCSSSMITVCLSLECTLSVWLM